MTDELIFPVRCTKRELLRQDSPLVLLEGPNGLVVRLDRRAGCDSPAMVFCRPDTSYRFGASWSCAQNERGVPVGRYDFRDLSETQTVWLRGLEEVIQKFLDK
jgi:hypothetical protein